MKNILSLCLILNLTIPPSMVSASTTTEQPSFEAILKTSQFELDTGKAMPEESIHKFANQLLVSNIGVSEIDSYVKSKLTPKEYLAYEKQSRIMMKGLDPEKMTPNEFSQVVSRALEVTQPKALTWSSCSTLTVGILVAVAAVIVGIVAIAKRKIDKITEEGLYNDWQNKNSAINAHYADTNSKLNDPQGYFNRKIREAQNSISSERSDNNDLENKIDTAESRIRSLRSDLYSAYTEEEKSSIRSRINSYENDIDRYEREIRDNNSDIDRLQNNISTYQNEKIRYMNPQVVIDERAALEAWLPQALLTAEQNYQISLKDMPADNIVIDAKNVKIMKTKKTLGIIAGVGGGASLALILSSVGSCEY
jgi:chaperonin cofactor prefoldin